MQNVAVIYSCRKPSLNQHSPSDTVAIPNAISNVALNLKEAGRGWKEVGRGGEFNPI